MNTKKLSKKEINLTIILIIIVFLTIGLIVLKIVNKSTDHQISSNSELEELVSQINNINLVYENIDLDDSTKYTKNANIYCYKYNGDDIEEYIKKINDLYVYSFSVDKGFDIVYTKNENGTSKKELYACMPKNCKVSKITSYKFVNEEENSKAFIFNDSNYVMLRGDNGWKFIQPVVDCAW